MQSVPITTNDVSSNPARVRCTQCDKVCQWLSAGRWFSPGTPVTSTNKTDHHDIAEILLNVALSTITLSTHFFNLDEYMCINVDVVSGRDKITMDVVSMEEDTCLDMADFE